jgi:cell division protein FtsW (lipid II flippase)
MLIIIAGGFIICRYEKDPVDRLLSGGMTTVLLLPFIVNLLTMFGFLPPGSIGFPFLSCGGSTLLASVFALSFFFRRKKSE